MLGHWFKFNRKLVEQSMIFSLGPVMRYELITTSRRRRYYVLRVIYGLVLLTQLWGLFRRWEAEHAFGAQRFPSWARPSSLEEVQAFAEDAFIQFAGVQGLALLLLIPALVAGIIPDEFQRKTLHYLLASRLSSAEIVLGKLGARLVHVVAFVALGLPIVSLLMLYGGLNPVNIFYVYMGTATLVLFAAGFSTLISVLARRPRDAILAAYGVGAIWLFAPFTRGVTSLFEEGPLGWIDQVNRALLVVQSDSRLVAFDNAELELLDARLDSGLGGLLEFVRVALRIDVGHPGDRRLALLDSWPLPRCVRFAARPGPAANRKRAGSLAFDRGSSSSSRHGRLPHSRATPCWPRAWNRPSCGEDPMLWKERFTRMGGGLKWLGSRPVALFFIVLLCCYLADMSASVVVDLFSGTRRTRVWEEINLGLRTSTAVLAVLAILPIGAAAASSITSEREGDTWISLATTLLTPREVIRGKQFGAVWSARWLGIGLICILAAGLVLGVVHPIGLAAGVAMLVTCAWLTAAIGVLASTLAANSTRALFLTATALFVYGIFTTWPYQFWMTLASYRQMQFLRTGEVMTGYYHSLTLVPPLGTAATLAAVNSVIATLLSYWSVKRLKSTWGRG